MSSLFDLIQATGILHSPICKEENLAKTALRNKAMRKAKFDVRAYNRCPICGRPRGYIRKFGICRICFRNMASEGKLPGVIKSSW